MPASAVEAGGANLIWTTTAPAREVLVAGGYHVVSGARFLDAVAAAQAAGAERRSLDNPAAGWLAVFARHRRVAVLGVPCRTLADLRRIHGYLLEPAYRRGCGLLVQTDGRVEDLDPAGLVDADRGYAWTVERVEHLVEVWVAGARARGGSRDAPRDGSRGVSPGRSAPPEGVVPGGPIPRPTLRWLMPWRHARSARAAPTMPPHLARLDPQQRAAATAGDGVVQVIAPAGSGKTTVLVARVAELARRGTPVDRILCTAFNRDARQEIAARLERAGLAGVMVRTFHGLGREILAREGYLRRELGGLPAKAWQALALAAADAEPDGVVLEPAAAQHAVGGFKLAGMVEPAEALARARDQDGAARTAARLYALYEAELARRQQHDLDDLLFRSVRLLQARPAIRRRWQRRCARVLVDEYQDIEPAQALLVSILAAPQDSLFCVGDEDQCIYAWRRARVQSVVELDRVYPGLERHALAHNYRCGRRITAASRRLVSHNRERFRKPLHAGARHRGEIAVHPAGEEPAAAAFLTVALLRQVLAADEGPPDVVVLARSLALLREVAIMCRRLGVPWRADPRLAETLPPAGPEIPPLAGGKAAPPGRLDAASHAAADPGGHPDPPLAVALATVHASKGREWDHVILHGADQGRFPSLPPGTRAGALAREHLEAERRLFYVALTRARRRLDVVCMRDRPSQFLAEAGLHAG